MKSRFLHMVMVAIAAITIFLPTTTASPKKELKKFEKFIRIMDERYIDSLDYHYMIEVAIRAILDQTDPYSTYIKSKQIDNLSTMIESSAIDTTYVVNDSTACIKVALFSRNTAIDIFHSYKDMNSPNNLILDFRGNQGGLVTEAICTSNLFLKKEVPLFKWKKRNKKDVTCTTQYDGELLTTKLYVVIDRESASACEIVAAALQHNDRAKIVGERSKGKALIVTPFSLPDKSMVVIATSQYTTPVGGVIQRSYRGRRSNDQDGGVIPDIKYDCEEVITSNDFLMFVISAGKR